MTKFLFSFAFILSASIASAKDLALIIGIDTYSSLPSLNKAVEDANGYRALFDENGYDVTYIENPNATDMRISLATFYNQIEQGDTVVFVYSGHGWSDGLQNFLVPADTPDLRNSSTAAELTLPLRNGVNGVLDRIAERGAGLSVAIIDACRDNPFSGAETRTSGLNGGLAPIEPPSGSFIVYSAAANQTALDRLGSGDDFQYSVFTRFFLPNLRQFGDLRVAIVETRGQVQDVAEIVGHRQRPAYYDELGGTSCLFGDCQRPQSSNEINVAEVEWEVIKGSTDRTLLDAYVQRHKESNPVFANMARGVLLELAFSADNAGLSASANIEITPEVTVSADPATAAFNIAKTRIANHVGAALSLSDLPDLQALPPEIGGLQGLLVLQLENTKVADLFPISRLSSLEELYLAGTPLNSLTHLARLENLERLSLNNTAIDNISPLARLNKLQSIELDNTRVADLVPLYVIRSLRDISFQNTPAEVKATEAERIYNLAWNYQNGIGVWQNYGKALRLYQQALDLDEGDAANQIGSFYDGGDGVEDDTSISAQYYRLGMQLRSGSAAYNLGILVHNGDGVAQDKILAAQHFIRAVELNNVWMIEAMGADFFPETIMEIQRDMTTRGLYHGQINGYYGEELRAALRVLCECG